MDELVKHLEKKNNKTLQYMLNAFIASMGVLVVAMLIFVMSFSLVHVCGNSMLPTLEHHSFGLSVRARRVSIDDIVIIRMEGRMIGGRWVYSHNIKRVVAVGGDTVVFRRGEGDERDYVFLYLLDENNRFAREINRFEPIRQINGNMVGRYFTINIPQEVPFGEVMVLGDNRNQSRDSRNDGFIPMERVAGRFVHDFEMNSFSERLVMFIFRESGNCTAPGCIG